MQQKRTYYCDDLRAFCNGNAFERMITVVTRYAHNSINFTLKMFLKFELIFTNKK